MKNLSLVVQKYGGTSVGTPERIQNVARRIVNYKKNGNDVIVAVSAMGDSTDELLEMVSKITDNPPPRELDMLLATGEQVSIAMLAMAIDKLGYSVVSLTGPQAGIQTENVHNKARITDIDTDRLHKELKNGNIIIVAGFQGINEYGDITTLGRGGSDTTAVAVAAAVKADVCEIYTDVDGVYTTDPRIVPEARKLKTISYDEMLELASLGALVLQPRSVEFAKLFNVPIHVRSSFNNNTGTMVQEVGNMEKNILVTGVACDNNVVKLGIFGVPDQPGVTLHIFKALAEANVNVDMIIQSTTHNSEFNDISFTTTSDNLNKALDVLHDLEHEIKAEGIVFDEDVAKVSIVGAGMITNCGVAAKMFEALAEECINIDMISTSEIKVSCIVKAKDAKAAVRVLHNKFDLQNINNE